MGAEAGAGDAAQNGLPPYGAASFRRLLGVASASQEMPAGNPTVGVRERTGEIAPQLENCAEFRAVWPDTREALASQRAPAETRVWTQKVAEKTRNAGRGLPASTANSWVGQTR